MTTSSDNWEKLVELAKEGLNSRGIIKKLKTKISNLKNTIAEKVKEILGLKKDLEGYKGKSLSARTKYFQAQQRSPKRLEQAVDEILRNPPEQEQITKEQTRSMEYEK